LCYIIMLMKIGLAQINPKVGDLKGNKEKILSALHELKEAEIVVFPELALTGYPPEDLLLNRDFQQQSQQVLREIAQSVPRNQVVILGAPEKEGTDLYNSAFVLSGERIIDSHRKVFLPNYDVFDELRYFRAGSMATVLEFANTSMGVVVCEDLWHPDGPAQWASKAGASTVLCINASPYEYGKVRNRLSLLQYLAKSLDVNIVYVNMVGGQDELLFDGGSLVVQKDGRVTCSLPFFEESLCVAHVPVMVKESAARSSSAGVEDPKVKHIEVNLTVADSVQVVEGVTVPEDDIGNLYKGLVFALSDYVKKQGFKGAIVPVSGGVDSALVAAMSVDALGPERVKLVYLPSRFNSPESFEDASLLANNLGCELSVIQIDSIFEVYEEVLREKLHKQAFDVADENLQARIRANIAFYLSNMTGYLVLSCSNKSESAVGYGTIYGDMAGGFAPIRDVLKTQVYELARYRNSVGFVIPERTLRREPSAELNVNQRDQDILPPYEVLDPFLEDYIVDNLSFAELEGKYGEELTRKVLRMVKSSEFKRKQAPVAPKVSRRNFGKGWRMPIVNGFNPGRDTDKE